MKGCPSRKWRREPGSAGRLAAPNRSQPAANASAKSATAQKAVIPSVSRDLGDVPQTDTGGRGRDVSTALDMSGGGGTAETTPGSTRRATGQPAVGSVVGRGGDPAGSEQPGRHGVPSLPNSSAVPMVGTPRRRRPHESRHRAQMANPKAAANGTGQAQFGAGPCQPFAAPHAIPITKPAVPTINAFSGFMFRLPFRDEPSKAGLSAPCGTTGCLRPVPAQQGADRRRLVTFNRRRGKNSTRSSIVQRQLIAR